MDRFLRLTGIKMPKFVGDKGKEEDQHLSTSGNGKFHRPNTHANSTDSQNSGKQDDITIDSLVDFLKESSPENSLKDISIVLKNQKILIEKLLNEREEMKVKLSEAEKRTDAEAKRSKRVQQRDMDTQTEYICDPDMVLRQNDIRWMQDNSMYLFDDNDRLKRLLNERQEDSRAQAEVAIEINTIGNDEERKADSVKRSLMSVDVIAPIPVIVKKVVKLQIYKAGTPIDIVLSMEESLKREIQHRLSSHNVDVNFEVLTGKKPSLEEPSLVLCPNFSRLGTDVNSAFSGLQNAGKGTVLLVLHYKEEHNLPKVKSESLLSQFNHLEAILDMAFRKEKGFYSTNINSSSFHLLVNFVLKYAN